MLFEFMFNPVSSMINIYFNGNAIYKFFYIYMNTNKTCLFTGTYESKIIWDNIFCYMQVHI